MCPWFPQLLQTTSFRQSCAIRQQSQRGTRRSSLLQGLGPLLTPTRMRRISIRQCLSNWLPWQNSSFIDSVVYTNGHQMHLIEHTQRISPCLSFRTSIVKHQVITDNYLRLVTIFAWDIWGWLFYLVVSLVLHIHYIVNNQINYLTMTVMSHRVTSSIVSSLLFIIIKYIRRSQS